jgi:hypothetical protein
MFHTTRSGRHSGTTCLTDGSNHGPSRTRRLRFGGDAWRFGTGEPRQRPTQGHALTGIAELADSLGLRLLEHGSRALRFTDEGAVLHARAEGLLREVAEAGETIGVAKIGRHPPGRFMSRAGW